MSKEQTPADDEVFDSLDGKPQDILKAVKDRAKSWLGPDTPLILPAPDADFVYQRDSDSLSYESGPSLVSADASNATAQFVISSNSKDRMGDVVVPQGCVKLLQRYQKNPVVFFGHKSREYPIGSARDKDGNLALSVQAERLTSTCHFHLKTKESEDVFRLVEAGELRCASIGFIPHKGKRLKRQHRPDYDDDDPRRDDIDFSPYVCFQFDEWELLEWSIVPVPANADCVAMRLSKGFGGVPLSEGVRDALAPYAAPSRFVRAYPDLFPRFEKESGGSDGSADDVSEPVPAADPALMPYGCEVLKTYAQMECGTLCLLDEWLAKVEQPKVKELLAKERDSHQESVDAAVALGKELYPAYDVTPAKGLKPSVVKGGFVFPPELVAAFEELLGEYLPAKSAPAPSAEPASPSPTPVAPPRGEEPATRATPETPALPATPNPIMDLFNELKGMELQLRANAEKLAKPRK